MPDIYQGKILGGVMAALTADLFGNTATISIDLVAFFFYIRLYFVKIIHMVILVPNFAG